MAALRSVIGAGMPRLSESMDPSPVRSICSCIHTPISYSEAYIYSSRNSKTKELYNINAVESKDQLLYVQVMVASIILPTKMYKILKFKVTNKHKHANHPPTCLCVGAGVTDVGHGG